LAGETSTPLHVIERWPPEKTLSYFDAAMRYRQMKNGQAQPEQQAWVGAGADDPLGFGV
jgi:hypothetical protein